MKTLMILLFLFFVSFVNAADYYVKSGGNDSNDGLSDEEAWATISQVNGESYSAGDSISFNRDDTWRETLTVPTSGSDGSRITFGAYGTGADPIISGSEDITTAGWADQGGNVWRYAIGAVDPDLLVFDNAVSGVEDATPDSKYEWTYSNPNLDIYATDDPDNGTYYTSIEAATRDYCIILWDKDWIVIENLELVGAKDIGVGFATGSSNNIVQDCTVHNTGIINADNSEQFLIVGGSDNIIRRNICFGAGQHGVGIYSGDDNIIEHNTFYDNFYDHIDVQSTGTCDGTIIRYNLMYYTAAYLGPQAGEGDSIYVSPQAGGHSITNTEIYYNIVYNYNDLERRGIQITVVGASTNTGSLIYNNTIVDCWAAVYIHNGTGSVIVKNNIGRTDLVTQAPLQVFISTNKTINNNLWDVDSGFVTYVDDIGGGTGYNKAAWSDYQSESGFDADSPSPADPLFVDAANGDFHLQSGSPCIGTGVDVGLSVDYDGKTVDNPPEIGAYEFMAGALFFGNNF